MSRLPRDRFTSNVPTNYKSRIRLTVLIGYFTTGRRMNEEELAAVKGRGWDE